MRFHLLDHSGAERPRFSFDATSPGKFRAGIAGLQPHDASVAMQLRHYGNRSIRRVPAVASWHYTVAAEMAADNGRVWALFATPERTGYFVETMVGVTGARHVDTVWPQIVVAVGSLDDYLRGLNAMALFVAKTHPPKPNLRLVDD